MTLTHDAALELVRVQRLLPFGMLVSLNDGSLGIIREREIAWSHRERQSWQQRFQTGELLQAVRLREGSGQRVELSLRLAQNDPWLGIDARYPLGALVDGTVTAIQSYGAFIELQAGVTGLLHISRLPSWAIERDPRHLFWPGDRVRAIVERIDLKQRHIALSLGRAWDVRWQQKSNVPPATMGVRSDPIQISMTAPIGAAAEEGTMSSWTVLVIKDDSAQLNAMTRWMSQAGHHTLGAASGHEALAALGAHQPDLVLSDVGLPDTSGIALLRRIRELHPSLRCALMADWTWASEQMDAIAALRTGEIQLLIKPFGPAEIIGLLTDDPCSSESLSEETLYGAPAIHTPAPVQRQLREQLRQLCSHTGAIKAVIFCLDPAQRQVTVLAEAGTAALASEATSDLIHSPVRDVAEDGQTCRIENTQEAETRVRYLKPLLPFRACLGLRLPTSLEQSYALFLFAAQPATFHEGHEDRAAATALAAAAVLERRTFQHHAQDLQRLALLGQLSRALVHEINHQLSPVNFVLSDIKQQLGTIERRASDGPELIIDDLHELQEIVQDLGRSLQSLTDTARMFSRVTMQVREQSVDLATVLEDAVQLLRDMADRAHVRLEVQVPDDLTTVHAHALRLQQIILNITLNAIQQIALARPAQGGKVVLRVERDEREQEVVTRICIEDDGPGIHRQLWQRVFDLGYTTRSEGGSGLGLYITRSLGDALDCRIFIEDSAMLWGSTFVVELRSEAVR